MTFPVWQPDFPVAWLIALVATVHVAVSQFAVGGGLFLVLLEHRARKLQDPALREFLVRFSRFFALLTLTVGAVTGVGIWFTIGLISPEGTLALIRTFVWVWAVEWVFFLVEAASILVYAKGWEVLPPKTHLAVGWIYFAAAYASLVAIGGILAFQLTPGRWLEEGSLSAAFFNPNLLPSLVVRSLFCLLLAGLYTLVALAPSPDRVLKAEVGRRAGLWVALPALLLFPALYAFFTLLPPERRAVLSAAPSVLHASSLLGLALLHLAVLPPLLVLRRPRTFGRKTAITLFLFGLLAVGTFEWAREGLRKPWLIPGYLYGNHLSLAEVEDLRGRGLLAASPFTAGGGKAWSPEDPRAGKALFLRACGPCHGLDGGPRALRPRLRGLEEPYVATLVRHADLLRGPMPPFPGTPEEAAALARYILQGSTPVPPESGARSFRRRCAPCHTVAGPFRPLAPAFSSLTPEDAADLLLGLDALNEAMPPWTGTDGERNLLARYLVTASRGEAP
ncbi:MAG: c-type cytochrome [Acidobacteriota bacterium]